MMASNAVYVITRASPRAGYKFTDVYGKIMGEKYHLRRANQ